MHISILVNEPGICSIGHARDTLGDAQFDLNIFVQNKDTCMECND